MTNEALAEFRKVNLPPNRLGQIYVSGTLFCVMDVADRKEPPHTPSLRVNVWRTPDDAEPLAYDLDAYTPDGFSPWVELPPSEFWIELLARANECFQATYPDSSLRVQEIVDIRDNEVYTILGSYVIAEPIHDGDNYVFPTSPPFVF